jgi:hypothetical protein
MPIETCESSSCEFGSHEATTLFTIGRDAKESNGKERTRMTRTFHGTVFGQSIQIDEALDIADGEEVEVVVRRTRTSSAWGEGIRRSAGAAASIPEFDEVFAQIERERKAAQFRETNE